MSVSATYNSHSYQSFDRLVPDLPSENAVSAFARVGKTVDPVSDPDAPKRALGMFQEGGGPGFADLLDMINPLQHIPIVNSIYRELSGDEIGVGARLAGGALFGGPIGLALAAINSVMEVSTGNDIGGHMMALFKDGDEAVPAATAVASDARPAQPLPNTPLPAAESGDAKAVVMPDLLGSDDAAPAPARVATAAPTPVAPPVIAETASAPAVTAAAAEAQPRPMPVRDLRMMPAPGRNLGATAKQVPMVAVPVSGNSARSNVPITGARVGAAGSINPVLVQQMVASQAQPGRNGGMTVPGGSAAAAGPTQGWFSGSMLQALDKYDRSAKMGQQTAVTAPVAAP